jgi:hypothetical protein
MDFFLKNLSETLKAINKMIEDNINLVSTKRVRRCNNISSNNRSKINFIWRSLAYLEDQGILKANGSSSPKSYNIIPAEKINIKEFIAKVKEER